MWKNDLGAIGSNVCRVSGVRVRERIRELGDSESRRKKEIEVVLEIEIVTGIETGMIEDR